ncbi:putative polyprotein, partial [Tanacetum coccineum]
MMGPPQWSLPPAYAGTGALLVLLEDPGLRALIFKVGPEADHDHKEQNEVLKEKLVECENQIKKNKKEYSKGLQQISSELQESKPLTKTEVLELVKEIAQQPKKVEEEALKPTSELEKKVKRIEDQVHQIEH